MSKSLGNSPDPLALIEKYGADGVRVGMLLCSPAGNDLLFDESLPEQGRNFANKIWNAYRLVSSWKTAPDLLPTDAARAAINWFYEQLKKDIAEIEEAYQQYRISEALMTVYKLFWDEFASWYLEIIKPAPGEPIDQRTMNVTIDIFETLLKLLHPFMPFITEEIWQQLKERPAGCSIMNERNPATATYDKEKIKEYEVAKDIVAFVRNTRSAKQISPKEKLVLCIKRINYDDDFDAAIVKLANLSAIKFVEEKVEGAANMINQYGEFYIPLGDLHNQEEELQKLEKELAYTKGFLESVMLKLSNEKFANNAPAKVLEMEQKKKADAEIKIKTIEEHIALLKKQ